MGNDISSNTRHNTESGLKSTTDKTNQAVDQLASTADRLLNGAQQSMDHTFDSAKLGVNDLRDRVESTATKIGAKTSELADKGMANAREAADTVKSLYHQYSEVTCTYVADKPMRSLMISAAVGAAMTALVLSALQNRR
jgi:ElaB/YqjD/DUF883 family membrane-anchored ribosome-binding protein